MPTYSYICDQCQNKFEVFASIKQKEKGLQPVCPHCGSIQTRQTYGVVTVLAGSHSHSSGGSCCAPRRKS